MLRLHTWIVIGFGLVVGALLTILSQTVGTDTVFRFVLLNLGCALVATVFISILLDLFWSKERAAVEKKELEPLFKKFQDFTEKLNKLEGRLEAFKQLGLDYCNATRYDALERFLNIAKDVVAVSSNEQQKPAITIDIVSSSARGLVGYLDREAPSIQMEWRSLITEYPRYFRVLLTHPAYAHLRQPAEERSSGDIELEILKTAIYLHCVAGIDSRNLRFYRGSPTLFLIKINRHVLLNPYPYGKMAMDTLCLEFESDDEEGYVANFAKMHFDHTWAFLHQDSKRVDGNKLVEGIDSMEDILQSFSECSFLHEPRKLRLTTHQVLELDTFVNIILRKGTVRLRKEIQTERPFKEYLEEKRLFCADEIGFEREHSEAPETPDGSPGSQL
ncbi:MAG: hypothetical protein P9L99_21400 [Candidatus Lernaella stagnicola]|nr:hypothetical protein [Candidatus Lernaella stagnicola]